jgi:putative membrane protein
MLAEPGPLTAHMAAHILLMNAVGPLAAAALQRSAVTAPACRSRLGAASILQILLLWAWHAPPVFQADAGTWHLLMSGSLLSASIWYWLEIFRVSGAERWRAIVALLITSKLFCLLGVLYVFAPRALYPEIVFHHGAHPAGLADQQLAGLLMLAACPATYLLAGVWIAARWLFELERSEQSVPWPASGAASDAP